MGRITKHLFIVIFYPTLSQLLFSFDMDRSALLKDKLNSIVIDENETITTSICRLVLEMEKNGETYRGIHTDICKEKQLNRGTYERRMRKLKKGYSGEEIKKNGRPHKLTKKEMEKVKLVCQERVDSGNCLTLSALSDELKNICYTRYIDTGDESLQSFSRPYMRNLITELDLNLKKPLSDYEKKDS